ncbi:MAG: 50S ribosomal protein L11 methyltransferase [Chloroflexota bacterium]
MRWLELSCLIDREAAEQVGALFAQHGRGVVIEDVDVIEGDPVPLSNGPVTLRTYLAADETLEEKRSAIERGLWVLGMIRPVGELQTKELAETDWAEAWKEHFHVHRVGRRVVIKPTWRDFTPEADDVVVELDPGMAFGTGLHPTTQLCLQAIEDYPVLAKRVLDLGTGSGILAIAAARLGATRVDAVDTDPVAVSAATENVAINNLAGTIMVRRGSLPFPSGYPPYDLVLANIIARVIAELAPLLAASLAAGGTLIASGILAERSEEVLAALRAAGLTVLERRQSGDWLALVARGA